ncbi:MULTISPECIES: serine hydrolase [unclassified Duganella]|uniref:serine hydrolase domain-containing protein n=1 Tax=unclassified Duganella TaxID=2636909 RepID=UPI000E35304F|nr:MULTISPECIES: serine hydrolase [unclassified Duganella]RFP18827.1 class C beta-lactamase-related serine hydrolase [Duganella sp. BJB475]RFP35492.1 class C beta-lactamase-related serine hydrolase [Duganella sp. BJB476]
MARILKLTAAAALLLVGGAVLTLALHPPELLRVGASYGAKMVCSNVFIAGRDAQAVLADDVQAPGHPLLKLLQVRVDQEQKLVRADLLGFVGKGLAVYRPGTGCAVVPDNDVTQAAQYRFSPLKIWAPSANVAWPTGSQPETVPAVQALLAQDALAGPEMRGMAVIHHGRLVAQRYGAGFHAGTPLLGWSMTKTVSAALVGILIADGKLAPQQSGFWPSGDPRAAITLAQLMAMSSGLQFNEGYGDVSDVTRMLYLEPDMAAYAAAQPLVQQAGSTFNYSSGTTLLLSRIWQRAAAGANTAPTSAAVLSLPHARLFEPLGMSSAVMEADARGNLVGSSYMYATTQDWARFGQFLLQDGVWQGKRLLPEGFVTTMQQVAPASGGQYGQGQVWRWGPSGATPEGQDPDPSFKLPADTYWLEGHDGQTIAIVPSKQLVLVRLGLTPDRLNYQPQALLSAVIRALE